MIYILHDFFRHKPVVLLEHGCSSLIDIVIWDVRQHAKKIQSAINNKSKSTQNERDHAFTFAYRKIQLTRSEEMFS